jgi:hypothetical protein
MWETEAQTVAEIYRQSRNNDHKSVYVSCATMTKRSVKQTFA